MADASSATNPSILHIYSFAIAAENLDLQNPKFLECTSVEDQPMASGVLSANSTDYASSGTDSKGAAYQTTVKQTVTVKAEWMPLGSSNRMTPPNIRVGERLMLYRMGDTDKYYWVTCAQDMNLRKLETVIHAWNGSQDETQGTDGTNSYFFEVSTHNKLMHLHTSKANGEVCGYDVQVNPGTGKIQIQDDIGNFILMDSVNQILQMQTVSGAVLQLNKKDGNIQIPGTWNVQANMVNWQIAETFNITCPQTTHKGNFAEVGLFQLAGDMVTAEGSGGGTPGTGQMTIAANLNLQGNADITGTTTTRQLTSEQDVIAPNVN